MELRLKLDELSGDDAGQQAFRDALRRFREQCQAAGLRQWPPDIEEVSEEDESFVIFRVSS